jgi:predicted nuclease of restriction endonuclease-like (RecB) superfamily
MWVLLKAKYTIYFLQRPLQKGISMAKIKKYTDEYSTVLNQVKQIITQSQEQFLRSANRISMDVRIQLGKIIDENSTKYEWGKAVIENFSKDLTASFPGNTGFSVRNLAYMRQFYNEYNQYAELINIAKEVSWRTNIVIMTKVKEPEARGFYLSMAAETMCNRDVISAQISSKAFERGFLQDKKHNFNSTLPEVQAAKAENMLKSSYFFETTEALALTVPLLEKQVEDEMVCRIKDVLMMLGKGFSFMGSQYPLSAGNNNYRIDLLFFNRVTQSLIAVELKMTRFKAEFAGKMNLYLKLLDEKVKLPHENNSIGLILCADRNDVEVDYILPETKRPIGVAELELFRNLPKNMIGKLPDPKELESEILHSLKQLKE